MEIKIVQEPIKISALKTIAEQGFGDMVKAVVDIEKEIVAVGSELHADAEAMLVEKFGSERKNLWGINLYPEKSGEGWLEFDSMINIKPQLNNRSRAVENPKTRVKITAIINKLIAP